MVAHPEITTERCDIPLSYIRMISGQRRAAPTSDTPARDRLIAATTRLISTGGPQAATSRAIADAAGENLAAITYYFGSKDDLVSESLAAAARTIIEPVVAHLIDPSQDPVSKLVAATKLLQQILERSEDHLAAYVQSLATGATDGAVKSEIRRLHRDLAGILAAEMSAQTKAGTLPRWVHPEPMAQLIIALVNGVAIAVATDPEETDAPAIAAQFAQLLLAARTTPN
jgi:AcrR family transcriptional regulator